MFCCTLRNSSSERRDLLGLPAALRNKFCVVGINLGAYPGTKRPSFFVPGSKLSCKIFYLNWEVNWNTMAC